MIKKYSFLILLFFSLIATNMFGQPGATCATAINVTLPFSLSGVSTCGSVNNYTTICGGTLYAGGEDLVYSFTASATGITTITSTGGSYVGLFVVSGCPSGPSTCVGSATAASGTHTVVANVVAGQTYYIILDSWPAPACNSGLTLSGTAVGPPPAPNNQDCLGAIPVCGSTFSTSASYVGTGNYLNEINPGISCLGSGEMNDVWYQFTVQTTGLLCLTIDPNVNTNDYDWAVFDLTSANCSDIATNPALQIACDYSGQTTWYSGTSGTTVGAASLQGNTGMFPAATLNPNNTQANPCINVTAGQNLVLNVSNFSSSANGYTLTFPSPGTPGMATIFDNIPPHINSITGTPSCGTNSITFNFSENILCSTASAADFTVTGPGGPYTITGLSGPACVAGATSENTFTVTFTPAITTSGAFNICLVAGAGSVTDLCGNVAPAGCLPFNVIGTTVTATSTNVLCSGGSTGTATATGASGTAPYTYVWNPGALPGQTVSSLAAGTYTVTCTSASGCSAQTTVTITQPPVLTATAAITPASCGANNGAATITPAGGTPGYTYNWLPSGGTSATASGLAAGTYTVTVKDANNCSVPVTVVITTTGAVTSTFTQSPNQCLTGNTFNFTNTGTSSVGTTFSWTFTGPPTPPASSTSNNLTGVTFGTAGTYTVTHVITLGSCTSTTTSTVIIYPSPTAVFTSTSNATCGNSNGSVTIGAVTSGTAPFVYNFNGGGFSATTSYTGLAAGTYPIIVQDANGCTFTSSVIINNSPAPTAVVITKVNTTCGNSNGSVTLGAVTGGTGPYTYSFNGSPFTGTLVYSGLAAGTYTIIVKDVNGCIFTTTTIITNTPGPTALATSSTPAACGASTGTATIGAVTDGAGPYTYNFNSLGFSGTTSFSALASGSYTVIVKDANGCTFSTTVIVGNSSAPTALALSSTPSACASSTGTITIGATTGGTGPYTYSVNASPYTGTTSYTGLAAGTYTVSVKDAVGCIFTTTIVVGTVAPPTAVVTTPTNANCGASTGSVLIGSVTGGTASYTYNFNSLGFSGTTNYTGLAAGTYTLIVKDANGCIYSTTVVVGNNPGPTALATTLTAANCGLANGAILIGAVTGGTAPYTYSIGGAFTGTTNYTALLPGAYTVTVKDANGCTFSVNVTILNNSGLTASITAQTNVLCNGGATGSVTVTGTGSSAPYTYSINAVTFLPSGTFSGLTAGSYTITVKDGFGCSTTVGVTITQPAVLTASITAQTNVLCNGSSSGSVTIAGAGGTTAYTFSLNGGPFVASGTFTGLAAGSYTVTVKDANGCSVVQAVTITQPTLITLATSSTNATCTAANGTATVVASGGISPYIYSWSPAGGAGATTSGVAAGVYTVTVTDANGCIKTTTVTVGTSAGGTASIGSFTNVTCNGAANGTITVSMGGAATAPFSYVWTPSGSGSTATGLAPGTYTCTVTDANGCSSTVSQTITQPTTLTVGATFTNVGCSGGSDGTATATTAGGTASYTYLWLPGGFTTASISGLSIGSYTCTVTDSKGCTATASANITQPPALNFTSVTTPANCGLPNGSATVTGSGGFAPYTWTWSSGQTTSTVTGLAAGTYTVTIHDINLCTYSAPVTIANNAGPVASISSSTNVSCNGGNTGNATIATTGGALPFVYLWSNGQTTPTATNLIAGIYSVTATDANGCSATANITITQPPVLVANATSTNPVCFGNANGTALASATGGTTPYSYLWTSPGSPTTASVIGLNAGTYNVTITDANGCIQSSSVTLTNPAAVTTAVSNTSVLCNGACNGTATATVSSGFTPYSFIWTNPTAQTTATATGLCAGTFTVNVLDAHGCPSQATTTVTQPTALTSMISSTANVSCFGVCNGFAQVTAGGGTPPYSYNWMPGAITSSLANSLCAGTYTCTVTDGNGCTVQSIQTISQPSLLTAAATGTNITCFGACNGTATVNYAGGTAPYSFLWSPGLQTVFNPTGMCVGTQSVTVTDSHGCTAAANVTLTQPTQVIVTTNPINSNCGQANGSACAAVSGGVGPYTYLWNNPLASTTACANSIPAGTYNVTVTDATGCSATTNANINDISAPSLTINSSTNITCFGYNNGAATSTITGGVGPYSLLWTSGGQTVGNPTNLGPGINTLTVTDAAGCVTSSSVTILQPTALVSAVVTVQDASCFGVCDGAAFVAAAGGTAPLSWVWSDPAAQTGSTAINLCAGSYIVTITDANGCVKLDSATIVTQPSTLAISSSSTTDITCNGDANGTITTTVIGGTPFYTYTWQPVVSIAPVATGLTIGTYTLIVSDANGCSTTQNWTITEPTPLAYTSNFNAATCSSNNGTGDVVASGGTGPYTYQWNDPLLQTTSVAINLYGGLYSCVITDAHGCAITANFNIPDLSGPLVDSIRSTPVLCFGGSTGTATVYPKAGAGTPPLTYAWSPSGGTGTTASGLTAGAYNVVITDANGCTTSGVVNVTQPALLSLIVSSLDTICYGDTAQVYGQALGGNPAYTYTWSGASGAGLTGSGPTLVMPTTTTVYTISVVDSKGCTAGPTSMTVVVRPKITVVATDITICDGTSGLINAVPSGGTGGPYTYSWSNGPTTQSQTVSPTIATSPMNYIVTVNDGCSSPSTDTATVTVNPGSIGLLQGLPHVGCQPLLVNFTAISNNGVTYTWNYGDGTTGTGSASSHIYPNAGTYDVTVTITTAAGCNTLIDSLSYVLVNPVPNASFTASPNPASSLSPEVNFTDLSTVTITNWSWNFGDAGSTTDVSTLQNPSYSYTVTSVDTVVLIVTNQFGCKDTAKQVIDVIDDFVFYAPNSFTPDGNGVNDVFLPKGIGFDLDSFKMYIFDRWGNMIFSTDDSTKGWDGRANQGKEIAQMDVYVWRVELKDNQGQKHKYIGTVTIVK
jgi:gliding motility-associated-like protein